MAPTTLLQQKTATSVHGRMPGAHGHPLHISEMLAMLPAVYSVERVSVHNPAEILKAKKAVHQAFLHQLEGKGFSLVEILSPCPTYIGKTAQETLHWISDVMVREFPLGKIK